MPDPSSRRRKARAPPLRERRLRRRTPRTPKEPAPKIRQPRRAGNRAEENHQSPVRRTRNERREKRNQSQDGSARICRDRKWVARRNRTFQRRRRAACERRGESQNGSRNPRTARRNAATNGETRTDAGSGRIITPEGETDAETKEPDATGEKEIGARRRPRRRKSFTWRKQRRGRASRCKR